MTLTAKKAGINLRSLAYQNSSEMLGKAPAVDAFGPRCWRGDSLDPEHGRYRLPTPVHDELVEVIDYLRRNPLPVLALQPQDFELPATFAFARSLRNELDEGLGFALLERLPTQRWSKAESIAAYWLLASCLARPVAQSHDGKLIYDVTDSGRPVGNGVRPDITNVGQNFHTDNSYNDVPPHYVALLCLYPAKRGGISGIVHFGWALNEMHKRHPELLARLFEPYYFDRQCEHGEGATPVSHHPLFQRDDHRIIGRLSYRQVVNGHQLAGVALEGEARTALEAFEEILSEPGAAKTFQFEAGQIQIINNRALGHCRSAFEDDPHAERKRHLVRLWLRDTGQRGYGL